VTERHVLVTGGGRGIGAAVVERFVRDGHRVSFVGRSVVPADGDVLSAVCDVSDEDDVHNVFADLVARCGPVEILVNNAGVALSSPFAKTTLEAFESQLRVNTVGVFLSSRAVLPAMLEAGWGRIVTVTSMAAHEGLRYAAGYTASKHAALGLMRALAAETASRGITANCVAPAYVRTDMMRESTERVQSLTGRDHDAAVAGILDSAEQHHLIEPSEVADAVAYLASDAAASITGESLRISARR
jgi:NAD(P)-dependent dehydrogenase (short-subunit alcohol dehydrogenase family)